MARPIDNVRHDLDAVCEVLEKGIAGADLRKQFREGYRY